jgi:phosphate transport system substrate-binding protein
MTLSAGCFDQTTELQGAGATFPAPIYARWRALFNREYPEIAIHYDAVGSGSGINMITAKEVDFGASDALLKESEKRALDSSILEIPTVIGPVVLAYNLPDLKQTLRLSAHAIAGIYLGDITHWNDPAIQSINPAVDLPVFPIRVAHRKDSSGTTFIFTEYLSSISSKWSENVGWGKTVNWPTGDDWAGEGNDGVAHRILLEPGGIGYLELKYAQNAGLKYATLINRDGFDVEPGIRSVQAAEKNTPLPQNSYLKKSIVNAKGKNSYPIAGFTYLLVYKDLSYMDKKKSEALIRFLNWILTTGQHEVHKLHYTPLPEILRKKMIAEVRQLKLQAMQGSFQNHNK